MTAKGRWGAVMTAEGRWYAVTAQKMIRVEQKFGCHDCTDAGGAGEGEASKLFG